jgi:hypothetical protein
MRSTCTGRLSGASLGYVAGQCPQGDATWGTNRSTEISRYPLRQIFATIQESWYISLLRLVGTILIGLVLSTSAASLGDAAAARVEHPTN